MTSAIVLGGGRATRLDGADKAAVEVSGRSLIEHVYAAVRGCSQIVAVGPATLARPGVHVVREDPPFGGPVAAIAAALPRIVADETWVLACDLPLAAGVVEALDAESIGDDDGVVLTDPAGRVQWLAGRYRTAALRTAVASIDGPWNASMRRLADHLSLRRVADRTGVSVDLDTWDDVAAHRRLTKGTP